MLLWVHVKVGVVVVQPGRHATERQVGPEQKRTPEGAGRGLACSNGLDRGGLEPDGLIICKVLTQQRLVVWVTPGICALASLFAGAGDGPVAPRQRVPWQGELERAAGGTSLPCIYMAGPLRGCAHPSACTAVRRRAPTSGRLVPQLLPSSPHLTPTCMPVCAQVTAWIPLLDATQHNGCLQVVRGGHRSGRTAKHTCCAGGTW